MAEECTDVTTVEELSLFCRWIETGEATEYFIDLLPINRTDSESIYSALVDCLKSKKIQLSKSYWQNNLRGYIHFSKENRPAFHSSIEGQQYKPFYLLRCGEFI